MVARRWVVQIYRLASSINEYRLIQYHPPMAIHRCSHSCTAKRNRMKEFLAKIYSFQFSNVYGRCGECIPKASQVDLERSKSCFFFCGSFIVDTEKSMDRIEIWVLQGREKEKASEKKFRVKSRSKGQRIVVLAFHYRLRCLGAQRSVTRLNFETLPTEGTGCIFVQQMRPIALLLTRERDHLSEYF